MEGSDRFQDRNSSSSEYIRFPVKASWSGNIIIGSLSLIGFLALWFWFASTSPLSIKERVPGMDGAPAMASTSGSRTGPEGQLLLSDGVPADMKGAWPCFRGEHLDNISPESYRPVPANAGFIESWGIDVGEGFAGAAIRDGRVYIMDYDREKKADALRCLSLGDGKEIWRYTYPVTIKRNHGMSRTVPFVTESVVISLGPKCHVTCLNSTSGEKKWSLDLVQAYGTVVPEWYAGQNPLIDNGRAILAPGGTALLAAVDVETGGTVWESSNPHGWKMTHSSVVPMDFNGKRIYIYCADGGVTGVSAEDGRILWETGEWKIRIANIPSPLVIGDGRIFLCGGYDTGSLMLKLEENNGTIEPKILYRLPPERFGSTQHTPILYQGYLYGVRPDGQLVCLDLDGNEKWASGSANKFGLGSYMIAGTILYVLNDAGLLSRVEATPDAFRLVDRTEVLHGHESWGPIAFASGRMIVRDSTRMICLEVTAK